MYNFGAIWVWYKASISARLATCCAIAALGGIIGFVYASFQKPTYLATTTFVLEEDRGGGGGGGAMSLASSFGFDLGGGGGGLFSSSNIIELMKSRLVVEKTLLNPVVVGGEEMSLVEFYLQINKTRESWVNNPTLKNIYFPAYADRLSFNLKQDSVLETISSLIINNNLTIIQKDKKSSIISLTIQSGNEVFSKLLCEQ